MKINFVKSIVLISMVYFLAGCASDLGLPRDNQTPLPDTNLTPLPSTDLSSPPRISDAVGSRSVTIVFPRDLPAGNVGEQIPNPVGVEVRLHDNAVRETLRVFLDNLEITDLLTITGNTAETENPLPCLSARDTPYTVLAYALMLPFSPQNELTHTIGFRVREFDQAIFSVQVLPPSPRPPSPGGSGRGPFYSDVIKVNSPRDFEINTSPEFDRLFTIYEELEVRLEPSNQWISINNQAFGSAVEITISDNNRPVTFRVSIAQEIPYLDQTWNITARAVTQNNCIAPYIITLHGSAGLTSRGLEPQ